MGILVEYILEKKTAIKDRNKMIRDHLRDHLNRDVVKSLLHKTRKTPESSVLKFATQKIPRENPLDYSIVHRQPKKKRLNYIQCHGIKLQ